MQQMKNKTLSQPENKLNEGLHTLTIVNGVFKINLAQTRRTT